MHRLARERFARDVAVAIVARSYQAAIGEHGLHGSTDEIVGRGDEMTERVGGSARVSERVVRIAPLASCALRDRLDPTVNVVGRHQWSNIRDGGLHGFAENVEGGNSLTAGWARRCPCERTSIEEAGPRVSAESRLFRQAGQSATARERHVRVVLREDVRPDGSVVVTELSGARLPYRGSGICVVVTSVPSG